MSNNPTPTPNEVDELELMLKDASNDIDQILVQTVFKPLTAKVSKLKANATWGITSEAALLARQRIRNELGTAIRALITKQNQAYHAAGLRELPFKHPDSGFCAAYNGLHPAKFKPCARCIIDQAIAKEESISNGQS